MTSSDIAAWAQAIVGSVAIVVGAAVVRWQVKRGRRDLLVAEARRLDGLARLLVHLRDAAEEARAAKKKLQRFPLGHPAEPHARYVEVAHATANYPLENFEGEVAFEALLSARRVAREAEPLVNPEPELNVNPNFQATFEMYMRILNDQITLLRAEANRLIEGQLTRYTVEPSGIEKAEHAI
ncbi:hypothetical protein UC35_19940 [Ramlibacter tataouinensis]|uniref:Uncharacterized protein n=1 Tax=Ramlibacter tataouinensis TaxID=94132 RepID=A0A127JXF9_9BURK|nr:hypothetical protein UC35_19940 [Ramlibacter tataouinensis]